MIDTFIWRHIFEPEYYVLSDSQEDISEGFHLYDLYIPTGVENFHIGGVEYGLIGQVVIPVYNIKEDGSVKRSY